MAWRSCNTSTLQLQLVILPVSVSKRSWSYAHMILWPRKAAHQGHLLHKERSAVRFPWRLRPRKGPGSCVLTICQICGAHYRCAALSNVYISKPWLKSKTIMWRPKIHLRHKRMHWGESSGAKDRKRDKLGQEWGPGRSSSVSGGRPLTETGERPSPKVTSHSYNKANPSSFKCALIRKSQTWVVAANIHRGPGHSVISHFAEKHMWLQARRSRHAEGSLGRWVSQSCRLASIHSDPRCSLPFVVSKPQTLWFSLQKPRPAVHLQQLVQALAAHCGLCHSLCTGFCVISCPSLLANTHSTCSHTRRSSPPAPSHYSCLG